jgi:hypothetical protein
MGKLEKPQMTTKKLMVERKIIFDTITRKCPLSFKAVSKIKVVNSQLSGKRV